MCYYCGSPVQAGRRIGFSETCPDCGKDSHVCRMCEFYAPGAKWDCRETIDAPVWDKEKRNFCDWFSLDPKTLEGGKGDEKARRKEAGAKSAFDGLFKL